jgi:hypothetical protein
MQLFGEFLKKGIVRKITPDKARANFLITEADNTFEGLKERINKIGINEKNANSIIKDCYDIIMEIIRARLFLDGYMASGLNAHEAEVSYLKILNFSEKEVLFINDLRYFRNSITYYGKILDKEYSTKVVNFLISNHKKIRNIVNQPVR